MLKTTLTGNIGSDAEIKTFENGRSVISFSVAHSEKWTDKNGTPQTRTEWIRCNFWKPSDKTSVAMYLKKGVKVLVEGKPTASAYNNQSGELVTNIEINVSYLELLSSAQVESQPVSNPVQQQGVTQPQSVQTQMGIPPQTTNLTQQIAERQAAANPQAQPQPVNPAAAYQQPIAQPHVQDVNNPDDDLPFSQEL